MIANGVGGLHNDLLMVGLMAAGLVVAVEHGWAWGAALGGLAAAVKVPGGLICIAIALVTLPAAATLTDRVRRPALRSEERRGGKEWVSTCKSRWRPYRSK